MGDFTPINSISNKPFPGHSSERKVDFGAVQLKEIHLSALDEMGDDGAET